MILYIKENNFFIHSDYKDVGHDLKSGNDIALIGIDKDHYHLIDNFIENNQKLKKENNNGNFQSFFKENGLYSMFEIWQKH